MHYDPTDWYWQLDDGRIWSSGRRVWVAPEDATLTAWATTADRVPTRTPAAADVSEALSRSGLILRGPASTAAVRAEAARRIRLLLGARDDRHADLVISNGNREAIRLLRIEAERAWTPEEATRASALAAADDAIEAIRAASNAMEPSPPDDYVSDAHWPA